ncbi:SRPBCC domain-containing protein [Actinoplanes awajinensis]|uniref:Transcriptional regulator n=1 Tax=Actinoplanes awajinensis subsp. mycoplanecinus TaxID=135947 RepID=A0A117MLN4_9ACTN|nr:SRPBCC domain-containing protein [Actinoplanes awajinensis]KUL24174.1 transcriptional regulator [Actinoplanes awajinensis subsp. mycoplanecinus]
MSDTKVFRIWIKATPEKIWEALTDPEWNKRYGYGTPQTYDLQKGGQYQAVASPEMKDYAKAHGFEMADIVVEGEVLEADAPRRLVQTWKMLMDPGTAAEPYTTLTWDIEDSGPGVCRVTITHELTGAPAHAAMVQGNPDAGAEGGGGWAWVLSDLKSLLETGSILAGK